MSYIQPDVADESSQVSLSHNSQAELERLKQELLNKQQVCIVVSTTITTIHKEIQNICSIGMCGIIILFRFGF